MAVWEFLVVALAVVSQASAMEDALSVSSLGVTEYLRNPCMIVDTQVVEFGLNGHEAVLARERELAFSKIALAQTLLTRLHEDVDNECNTDFSLSTLPTIPNPFSHQIPDGYQMMERDLLFLTAHVYFNINDTYEINPRCSHESLDFIDHLRALTGRLENLMCSLRMLSNSLFHNHHVLEEVLSLRFRREQSCGGRAVWSCILINRVSQSLSLLKQLLDVDKSLSGDNDLAVLPPRKKSVGGLKEKKKSFKDSLFSPVPAAGPLSPSEGLAPPEERRSHSQSPDHRHHHHRDVTTSFILCMKHRFSPSAHRHRFPTGSLFHRQRERQSLGDTHYFTPSPLSRFQPHRDKTTTFLDSLRLCVSDRHPYHEDRWDSEEEDEGSGGRASEDPHEEGI